MTLLIGQSTYSNGFCHPASLHPRPTTGHERWPVCHRTRPTFMVIALALTELAATEAALTPWTPSLSRSSWTRRSA